MKQNFLDRAIAYLSPERAYRRLAFRQGLDALSGYDAAAWERLQPWTGTSGAHEQIAGGARDLLRARARDLELNSDIAQAAVRAIVRNVVGIGIVPQAKVMTKSGTYDTRTNQALEAAWKRWVRARSCDISRRMNFYELQALMLTRRIIDGEALCRLVTARDGIPLRLQGLEAEWLASWMYKAPGTGNYLISGVEVDKYFAPVAYWIDQASPDGWTKLDPVRYPAEDMIHLYQITRFSQVRGVTELAHVMRRMRETGEYLDAEVIAAKIAACFALLITRDKPGSGPGRLPKDSEGKPIKEITPGMVEYLSPGEQVTPVTPQRTASAVRDYVQIEQRMAGAGLGLSYEALSRDVSQTNYSSARVNLLEDRIGYRMMQRYMIEHFCRPVWERFVEACVLGGEVSIPSYWSDPERYHAVRWVAPGWAWVDPVDEVRGTKEELRGGLTTLEDVAAAQGRDYEEILDQLAREKRMVEERGLDLDIFRPAAPAGGGGNGDGSQDRSAKKGYR